MVAQPDAGEAREKAADVTPRGNGRGGHRTLQGGTCTGPKRQAGKAHGEWAALGDADRHLRVPAKLKAVGPDAVGSLYFSGRGIASGSET